jgi:hypothetical protein
MTRLSSAVRLMTRADLSLRIRPSFFKPDSSGQLPHCRPFTHNPVFSPQCRFLTASEARITSAIPTPALVLPYQMRTRSAGAR